FSSNVFGTTMVSLTGGNPVNSDVSPFQEHLMRPLRYSINVTIGSDRFLGSRSVRNVDLYCSISFRSPVPSLATPYRNSNPAASRAASLQSLARCIRDAQSAAAARYTG